MLECIFVCDTLWYLQNLYCMYKTPADRVCMCLYTLINAYNIHSCGTHTRICMLVFCLNFKQFFFLLIIIVIDHSASLLLLLTYSNGNMHTHACTLHVADTHTMHAVQKVAHHSLAKTV